MILTGFICAFLSTGVVDWRTILAPERAARKRLVLLSLSAAGLLLFVATY